MVLVMFCSPLIKPPVKVEAAVIPVVAGAAIVAAAMSALGIGVAAGFDTESLATAAQKVWDDLSDSVRNTIVLTQIAGHTVAHFTEQALRDIFSGLQTAFPQNATDNPVYSHPGSFSTSQEMADFFSQLGISNATALFRVNDNALFWGYGSNFDFSLMSNFRVLGYYNLPISAAPYSFSTSDGTTYHFLEGTDSGTFQVASVPVTNANRIISEWGAGTHIWSTSSSTSHGRLIKTLAPNLPFVSLAFDYRGLVTFTVLVSCASDQSEVHTIYSYTDIADFGAIPAPGQDVFNPASDKFYADGVSTMNNSVDDVINRLKEGVGETGQISDQPDVITVPGQIVGDSVTDQTKGADQAGTIGKDISTEADKAANDATNADRDTTKPSTPGEDTDIPDLSIPQIITTKFPFSIPWDLYRAVNILVAPAQAPKWELPLHFDMLNVNTTLTIDLSQFDGIAALLRWGLSLLFLISLIILSSTIIRR